MTHYYIVMDEICSALFKKLSGDGRGTYKIFYEDELLDEIDGEPKNRETLECALKRLTAEGCIDVKYARGDVFCVAAVKDFCPLPPPAVNIADNLPAEPPRDAAKKDVKNYVWVMLSAFAGSLIGGVICAVLGAAVL